MPETDRSPTIMEHEHWNTNCGNLIVPSSHVANGFHNQGLSKLSRLSTSSSSSDFILDDIPFGDDDEEGKKKESEGFMMQAFHAVGGVDAQVSSKKSQSFSSNSSSPDSPLDGPFKDDEKHGKRDHGNSTVQSSPTIGGIDNQVRRKTSRSSSSSSSSADSPLDGQVWGDTEEHKHTYGINSITRSCPAVAELDAHASSKMSRSSSSSSSSPDSSFNAPFKEDVAHDNTGDVNLMMQSFLAFDRPDLQASSKMSRSSNSSSPESSVNGPFEEDNKNQRNTDGIDLMMPPALVVDGLGVQASSKMSRSSSSSSSTDSSSKGPSEGGARHRKTNTGNLVTRSSPAVDVQVSSRSVRSSYSSSSSSTSSSSSADSPLDDPSAKDYKEFEKSFQTTASLPEQNSGAKIEDGKHKEPASRKTLPKSETPVSVSPTEVKNHSPESNLINMPTTESPPTQVMERPTNSPYRIPSHVFARTKSTNPVEWSVASNESLFSIHMGSTSFTRDQFLLRPEDLRIVPGESSTSAQTFNSSTGISKPDQMFNFPTNPLAGGKATDRKSHELAVETMQEVIKESEDQHHGKSRSKGRIAHSSAGSATSTRSFAFPILTDVEKGHSISTDGSSRLGIEYQQTESQKLAAPKTPSQPLEQKLAAPKTPSQPLEQAEVKDPPAGTQFGYRMRYLSCMSCCTFCR